MSEVNISYKTGGGTAALKSRTRLGKSQRARFVTPALIIDAIALWEAALVVLTAWAVKYLYLESYLGAAKGTAPYIGLGTILAVLLFLALRRLHLYSPKRLRQPFRQSGRLLLCLTGSFLILIAALYVLKEAEQISRGWMLLWFASLGTTLMLSRICLPLVLKSRPLGNIFRQNVAVYGAGDFGRSVGSHLKTLGPDIQVIGVFDDRAGAARGHNLHIDGGLDDLIRLGKSGMCDQIVVAVPVSEKRLTRVMDQLDILPVDVHLCPETMHLPLRVFGVSKLGRLQLLDVQRRPISGRNLYIKRALDLVLASTGLVVALPLFPFIALAIKLDSSGPVFFRQRRHGYNHQIIRVLKFRTMSVLEDGAEVRQVCVNDPRVTGVGRILRVTNLDELPQLFNVLKGDMSLVGPRPHALAHDKYYVKFVERYGSRLRVKPGITGWAQVNGLSGETSDPELMRQRVERDLYYIDHWSVWLDLEIILRTICLVLTGRLVH
jgi:putative colanic acid biosynthesis UDP-glucose lipid carrier transferase